MHDFDKHKDSRRRASILYEVLGFIVWLGTQVFYRKITVRGIEDLPDKNEPTILVSNHQNGMMDPIMLCLHNPRQLHFLTRADIFKKKNVNSFLRSLNMLPIYRPHDRRVDAKVKNQETMDESVKRIASGQVISLFPEGNHGNKKHLRTIKPGINKLVIEVLSRVDNQELYILPAGINYSNYTDFRSDLDIHYGKPIDVRKILEDQDLQSIQTGQLIREEVFRKVSELIVHISDLQYHDLLEENKNTITQRLFNNEKGARNNIEEFERYKSFVQKFNPLEDEKLKTAFGKAAQDLNEMKAVYELSDEGLHKAIEKPVSNLTFFLGLIIGLPLLIPGFFLNVLPAWFTGSFVKKNIKDPHFKSSIKLAVGTFSYLFYYLTIFITLWIVYGFLWSAAAIFFTIATGWIFLRFYDWNNQRIEQLKFKRLSKEIQEQILQKRDKLISLATEIFN